MLTKIAEDAQRRRSHGEPHIANSFDELASDRLTANSVYGFDDCHLQSASYPVPGEDHSNTRRRSNHSLTNGSQANTVSLAKNPESAFPTRRVGQCEWAAMPSVHQRPYLPDTDHDLYGVLTVTKNVKSIKFRL